MKKRKEEQPADEDGPASEDGDASEAGDDDVADPNAFVTDSDPESGDCSEHGLPCSQTVVLPTVGGQHTPLLAWHAK